MVVVQSNDKALNKISTIIDRTYHLAEIISRETMLEISKMFFNVIGINIVFVDNRAVPISPPLGSFPNWCQSHFSDRKHFFQCLYCFETGLKNSYHNDRSKVYQGKCGLTLVSAPLYARDNVLLGCLITGPVQLMEAESLTEGTNGPCGDYFKHLNTIPKISGDQFTAVATLISTLANYLTVSESLSRYQQELVSYQDRLLQEIQKTVNLEKEITEYQSMLKQAELRELQAKMNPHFLFNALNVIARLAFAEGAVETEGAVFALADVARYGIEGNIEMVFLKTELDHINSYLSIQRLRFGNRISVKILVKEEHLSVKILPFTLQPLVDNAFKHGFESVPGKHRLLIKVDEDIPGNRLLVYVIDDGAGIDTQRVTDGDHWCHCPGSSLENIHQRMRRLFGDAYGLQLQGPPDIEGTKATLIMPLFTSN
ncbi:PocR ligand-binding domain-containing protein [Dehalobacterium formicoaceticum]|uniref:PocR ligand-binding domain-containing protein n=1 Tax=Dehalobacterium formicoaceticum TaxID=51515 RepID=A0ABT1Y7Y8_9FIRM|nr:histidine kinase [Dehalobacterium formicoaceticum]MCR6547005.1 PocR ligand-binding domain-containing protein [Dehalobacterium formicoaceticum]